jgi:plasmid stabilization system protein ParE
MGYRVVFAAQADRDLETIVRFLAEKNSAAAERLGHALVDDALTLVHMPRRGAPVLARFGYRRIFHRPWFHLFYRIDESQRLIEIARVWDVRQNPASFSL